MSEYLTTPWDVADAFLTKFDEYRAGTLSGPVLNYKISKSIMNSIKADPYSMINFFVQTNYLIKHGLDEKFGKDSETSILGFMEWANLTYTMFIPSLSFALNHNDELTRPKLIPDDYTLGVPDEDASETFKNLEFSMDWIKPDAEPDTDQSPPDEASED